MKLQDYYDVMGVGRDASTDEIKHAYRAQVLRWHPDRHGPTHKRAAEARFKEIAEAYEVLSDPEKRRRYDDLFDAERWGGVDPRAPLDRSKATDADDAGASPLFSAMFGGGFEQGFGPIDGWSRRGAAPSVTEVECAVTVAQLLDGTATLELPTRIDCGTCGGDGALHGTTCAACKGAGEMTGVRRIDIALPQDACDGMRIELDGLGSTSSRGSHGGLTVTLRIRSDDAYRVVGADVHADLPIAPWEALDGARVHVRAPAGVLVVAVPENTRAGACLRLTGQGLRHEDGSRGDLFLTVRMDLPVLTSSQREVLRRLAAEADTEVQGGARVQA